MLASNAKNEASKVTYSLASFRKNYGAMTPPAHRAHQTVSFCCCYGVSRVSCGLSLLQMQQFLHVDVAIQPKMSLITKQPENGKGVLFAPYSHTMNCVSRCHSPPAKQSKITSSSKILLCAASAGNVPHSLIKCPVCRSHSHSKRMYEQAGKKRQ